MKLIVLRGGVYNIARNIKYIISINKANSYTINHFEYENLYILIKGEGGRQVVEKAESSQFDFFEHY